MGPPRIRPYLWPGAFLLVVTIGLVGFRAAVHHGSAARPRQKVLHLAGAHRYYRVKAGDTLAAIAAKAGVPEAVLRRLNPTASPTALFLGQRLRLP